MMKFIFMNLIMIILSLNLNFSLFFMLTINLMFMMNFFMMINNNFMNYYWMNLNFNLGMDSTSFSLSILTIWIMSLSIMSQLNIKSFNLNFININYMMMLLMILSFCSINLIMFYIFFEASLIPIILIIMGWGYQIDRIQASMYMLFYTLFGSLPLLMIIMKIFMNYNSIMMNILIINYNKMNNILLFLMMNMAFIIKMPMYLTHLWLPKAHVEAPISGSMILAGIMLKLGSYGMYRFSLMFNYMFSKFNLFFISLSITGSLISSMICFNQNDLKMIVAYSSVVHMSFLMASILTMTYIGTKGSLMMMIAHGLCSSCMFFMVNLFYKCFKSRNIFINKNLINFFPSMTLWWFLICSCNFSAPPSLNLFSEIFMINSLIQWNNMFMIIIIIISFFSTCYSIYLYAFSQYGKLNYMFFNFKMINCQEYLMSILHWLPLNLIFLNMNFMI